MHFSIHDGFLVYDAVFSQVASQEETIIHKKLTQEKDQQLWCSGILKMNQVLTRTSKQTHFTKAVYMYVCIFTLRKQNILQKICCPLVLNFALTAVRKENQLTVMEISFTDVCPLWRETDICFLQRKVVS